MLLFFPCIRNKDSELKSFKVNYGNEAKGHEDEQRFCPRVLQYMYRKSCEGAVTNATSIGKAKVR